MITTGICTQSKLAMLKSMERDEFYLALYTKEANLNPHTATYTPDGEVIGSGYFRGGIRLSKPTFGVTGSRAWMDFDDPRLENATIKAWGGMIYNRTRNNLAIAVLEFDDVIASTNAPWWLELPPPGETAIIRWA